MFAREIELPAISGFVDLFNSVSDGALALVDADAGLVTLRPAVTQDSVFANVVCREDTVRAMSNGADKPLPFLGFLAESNPALGRRGIHLIKEYPELLETKDY